ncbi:MAG: mobile mystery protein A [Candidatus Methylomirabilaceae bacterium]
MDKSLRELKLRQLDASLDMVKSIRASPVPKRGWVSELRDALRMSTTQLGQRLGLTRQAVSALEHAEAEGSITLRSLRRAADALDCDLVYVLLPRSSLGALLDKQARAAARATMKHASHNMALERQEVSDLETEVQSQQLTDRLRSEWPRNLWETIEE